MPRRIGPGPISWSDWSAAWPHLAPALALAGGTHLPEDILAGVRGEWFQLWLGERSACLTEIVDYPRLRALRFFLAGGDLDELREIEAVIGAWGAELGCTRREIAGRAGWERALPGYRRTAVWLTKDVSDG